MVERDIAKRFWRLVRTDEAHREYRKLRNRANALIFKAKDSYYDFQFRNCKYSKSIWTRLKNLGVGKDSDVMSPTFTADEFNRHLCEKAIDSSLQDSAIPSTRLNGAGSVSSVHPILPVYFAFHNVSYEETLKSIV